MKSHVELIAQKGQDYIAELDIRIADEGMYSLLMRKWFTKTAPNI
jgi:hypothetical protein